MFPRINSVLNNNVRRLQDAQSENLSLNRAQQKQNSLESLHVSEQILISKTLTRFQLQLL